VSQFSRSEAQFAPLYRFSSELLANPPVWLSDRADGFDTDEEVWQAVGRAGSNWVVSDFGQVGETIVLEGPTGLVRFRVAGSEQFGILDGIIGSNEQLSSFVSAPLGATMLVDTREGVNARSVARRIEASLFGQGVDATTTAKLLDDGYRANKTFFSVIDVLMRLGLVVGILSLGILGLRAVVERRHVIGVLRAIGYKRWLVMWGLMAEAWITASIGVFVGVAVGVGMGYVFFSDFAPDTPFGIDGPTILSALGLIFGAVLIVTLGPAWRASRLPPAEAVRYSE
jgi:ABC-type antimicrobial peptide transport system permease subunit